MHVKRMRKQKEDYGVPPDSLLGKEVPFNTHWDCAAGDKDWQLSTSYKYFDLAILFVQSGTIQWSEVIKSSNHFLVKQ